MVTAPAAPRSRVRDALIDWAPVLAVAVLAQSRLGMDESWTGSSLGLAATGLASALPLAWRRTRPFTVALAVGVVLLAQEFVVGGSLHFGSFCAVLIAMYSLGRHGTPRLRAVLGGVLLGALVMTAMADETAASPLELLFPLFYFSAAWALGAALRKLERRGDHLLQLNSALEREKEGQARLAVASERIRLARELHDGVAHTVMLMVIQAEAAEETLGDDEAATARSLAAISTAGRHGLDDLRSLVDVLRDSPPLEPEPLPLLEEIPALCERLRETGLEVELTQRGEVLAVTPSIQASAYRVIQEAVTNVLKHSSARRVTVEIVHEVGVLNVLVIDPGPARGASRGSGGDASNRRATSSGGHGLAGMRERVSLHRGRIVAGPAGEGYRVSASFPMRAAIP